MAKYKVSEFRENAEFEKFLNENPMWQLVSFSTAAIPNTQNQIAITAVFVTCAESTSDLPSLKSDIIY